jgi:hypothetical protein
MSHACHLDISPQIDVTQARTLRRRALRVEFASRQAALYLVEERFINLRRYQTVRMESAEITICLLLNQI